MSAHRYPLLCLSLALASAALAAPAMAADAPAGHIAGLPAEAHLPVKFQLRWIQQMTTNRLDSAETPDMLAGECNQAMKAAGWSGSIVSHAPGPSSGSFNKGERFARVTISPTPNGGGSSMDVETNGKLGPGETLAAQGELPGDVCKPASAQPHPGFSGQQNTMVVIHAEKSKAEMAEESRQAMSAIGWEQTENSDMGPMLHMIFTMPGTQRSVAYAIKPGHGGTGSEVVIVANDVRH